MYFCRAEFDRYVITNSWGSSTEFYNWEDLCDIDITLPSIEQQRKYVDVYLALQNNLAVYQSKVDKLKLVCDGYIEELRRYVKKIVLLYNFTTKQKQFKKLLKHIMFLSLLTID